MISTNERVSRLSSDQVTALLAIGLMSPEAQATSRALDFLLEGGEPGRRRLLAALERDLRAPLLDGEGGPLSFVRLKPEAARRLDPADAPTVWEAATSATSGPDLLADLAHYGELLAAEPFLPVTRVFGAVVRALALTGLAHRHGQPMGPDDASGAAAVLEALAEATELPDWIRDHAGTAAAATLTDL